MQQLCAKKQREIIEYLNGYIRQLNLTPNQRFFECRCEDGSESNCHQTENFQLLHKNFEDCDPHSDNWSYECSSGYRECINQENAIECGIPLLNISISVS